MSCSTNKNHSQYPLISKRLQPLNIGGFFIITQLTYSELLSDPRWTCIRAKILKRDKYKCTVCQSSKNLHVHHTYYYDKMISPWDYPCESLIVLCSKCHEEYHQTCEVEIRQRTQHTGKKKRIKKARRKTKTDLLSVKSKKQRSYYSKKFPYLAKLQAEQGLRVKKKNGDIIIMPT